MDLNVNIVLNIAAILIMLYCLYLVLSLKSSIPGGVVGKRWNFLTLLVVLFNIGYLTTPFFDQLPPEILRLIVSWIAESCGSDLSPTPCSSRAEARQMTGRFYRVIALGEHWMTRPRRNLSGVSLDDAAAEADVSVISDHRLSRRDCPLRLVGKNYGVRLRGQVLH